MEEIVPCILGAVLGAMIWLSTRGRARFALSILAVIVSAAVATIATGEYLESWVYLLLDLGEAALGLPSATWSLPGCSRARATATRSQSRSDNAPFGRRTSMLTPIGAGPWTDALKRLVEQADFVLRAKAGRSKPWTAIEAEGRARSPLPRPARRQWATGVSFPLARLK